MAEGGGEDKLETGNGASTDPEAGRTGKPTNVSGETKDVQNAEKTSAPEEPKEKDEAIDARINSDDRVARQLMMSLFVVLYLVISRMMRYTSSVWSYNNFIDNTGDFESGYDEYSDDAKDAYDHQANYTRLYLVAYIFLFIAVLCHMYYFVHFSNGNGNESGARDGGSLAIIAPFLAFTEKGVFILRWVIIALYICGILFELVAFFIYMAYRYDEDYSPIDEDLVTDDTLYALKTEDWGENFLARLLLLILLLQHAFQDRVLYVFEWRIFMYSFVLALSSLVWVFLYISSDAYEYLISTFYGDDYEDSQETAFTFTSLFVCLVFINALLLCVYSGLQLNNMGQFKIDVSGGNGSNASYPDVYKIFSILAFVLFFMQLGFSVSEACANYNGVLMWVPVLMIVTDVLF